MTVEIDTFITLKEYKKIVLKTNFKTPAIFVLMSLALMSLVIFALELTGTINLIDKKLQCLLLFFVLIVAFLPFTISWQAEKHFKSNKMVGQPIIFTFDEERISYKLENAEGNIAWSYINKFQLIDDFIAIFTSDRFAYFIRANKLNQEQINFIKSKIKKEEV